MQAAKRAAAAHQAFAAASAEQGVQQCEVAPAVPSVLALAVRHQRLAGDHGDAAVGAAFDAGSAEGADVDMGDEHARCAGLGRHIARMAADERAQAGRQAVGQGGVRLEAEGAAKNGHGVVLVG